MESQKGDIRVVLVQTSKPWKNPTGKITGILLQLPLSKSLNCSQCAISTCFVTPPFFRGGANQSHPKYAKVCSGRHTTLVWFHWFIVIPLDPADRLMGCLIMYPVSWFDFFHKFVGSGTAELFGWKGCVMLFCCCGATSPQHFQKKTALNFVCLPPLSYALTELQPSSPFKRYICFVVERTESTMFLLVADTMHSSVWRDAHEFYEFWTNATGFAYYPTFGWWGWLDMYLLYPKSTGLRLLQRVFRHKGPSLQPQAASVQPNLRVCLCAHVSGNAAVR